MCKGPARNLWIPEGPLERNKISIMSVTRVYRLTAALRLHNLFIEALVCFEHAPGGVYLLLGAGSRSQ